MNTHVPESAHMQAHWNSVITATLMRHAALLQLVAPGETSPAKLPDHVRDPIARLCAQLNREAREAQAAHRPSRSIEQRINAQLWNALKIFSHVKLGQHEQLTLDPYPADYTNTRETQTSAPPSTTTGNKHARSQRR